MACECGMEVAEFVHSLHCTTLHSLLAGNEPCRYEEPQFGADSNVVRSGDGGPDSGHSEREPRQFELAVLSHRYG